MESNNKGTIYQQLNSYFYGIDNTINGTAIQQPQQPQKIIIKGNTPEEIRQKGLELQQKQDLLSKFNKTTDRSYQKALQYEAARLPAYMDYEGMEFFPLISSALDLFMEEATTIGSNGKMLNIYSNNERIKVALEDLFYNTIKINVNLPFWTRNLAKYGDNFCLIYGERKQGITHVKQMVNYEIERIERIENGKPTTKFKDRLTGSEFNIFEVAHFRLLGDDKFIPYGSSILNKVRRVFRQLCMAEDSMLTNRLLRAGDKRVFKIDVGNIDEEDVEEYMYKVATKFKRTPQVAPNDGQIDYRFNILGNDEDYFLPLRNGNSLTGIDTLQGSSTLDAIHDIEYLRDNLFIGLGIPKPFLSFQDASGAGKNMAQFDVRFAKKVIRLQQAMIEELNKMAIIHLMLLGFSESDIRDFQLTLTNPSIQHDLLKSELLREQAQTYTELTRGENGIAAMSHTRAKRLVFNMSDVDIVEDLKQQKMEKVVMQELADAPVLIKKSGLFADIDKKFGNETALIGAASGETTQGGEMPAFSPGGGPMNEPPMGGDAMGGAPTPPANGGAPSAPTGGNELPPISEQFTNYIHKLVGLNIKENNISTIAAATDIILENEKINNITFNLLKETNNIAEQDDIDINEINID